MKEPLVIVDMYVAAIADAAFAVVGVNSGTLLIDTRSSVTVVVVWEARKVTLPVLAR
jgi:hypothetical protein